MATYTPPPYFPQGSLAPPDEKRYRKFKLAILGIGLFVVALVVSAILAIWYLLK